MTVTSLMHTCSALQRLTLIWQWQSDAFGQGAPNTDPDQDGKKTHISLRFPGQITSEGGLYL